MWCVIPAAGAGTRLEPLTRERPKPLLEVGGKPILAWLLARLTPAVSRACLVVPERDGAVREALGDRHAGVELSYAVQERRLGVGDAILRAEPVVSGTFAVAMGDAWYDRSLSPCLEAWRTSGAHGAVIVEPVTAPPGDPIGLVRAPGGRVTEIRKEVHRGEEALRVAGAAVLPPSAFRVLAEARAEVLAAGAGEVELEAAVTRLLAEGLSFAAIPFSGWRRNINTPQDLEAVEMRIRAGTSGRRDPESHTERGT